jgi:hypothetical protein
MSCAPCDGRAFARSLAGPDAVDCGRVALGLSPQAVDRCAVTAMRAGRGFVVEQELRGIDSAVSELFVREGASGAMHRLVFDDGGPNLGVRITEQACADPMIVVREGFEQVTCTPTGEVREVCAR